MSRVATLPPERVWLRETKCLAVTEPLMRIASSLAGPRLFEKARRAQRGLICKYIPLFQASRAKGMRPRTEVQISPRGARRAFPKRRGTARLLAIPRAYEGFRDRLLNT